VRKPWDRVKGWVQWDTEGGLRRGVIMIEVQGDMKVHHSSSAEFPEACEGGRD